MLTTHIFLVLGHLISKTTADLPQHENEVWIGPVCVPNQPPVKIVADCTAAINMIPNGTIKFDGKVGKPLNFLLPPTARLPYYLPAAFRSGSCVVLVSRLISPRKDLGWPETPPEKAASAMYFTVWPFVREVARGIVTHCLPGRYSKFGSGGFATGSSKLTHTFFLTFEVSVRGTLPDWPGEKGKITVKPSGKKYNVYEERKTVEGKGAAGSWANSEKSGLKKKA